VGGGGGGGAPERTERKIKARDGKNLMRDESREEGGRYGGGGHKSSFLRWHGRTINYWKKPKPMTCIASMKHEKRWIYKLKITV